MKPLGALGTEEARRLVGVAFDLDDTVLDAGALTLDAYAALFALREAGLELVACTGRPSGWGEVIARQWPVSAVVVENGAFAWWREPGSSRVASTDPLGPESRAARRARLLEIGATLIEAHPELELADDNRARSSDVTLDVGEHRRVPRVVVEAVVREARQLGVRTHLSSVHLHLTYETDDKASGLVRLLTAKFGEDATIARSRWAFVGDSGNDAAAFAAFRTTFGVANVREHARSLTVEPHYVAERTRGAGFVEIARSLARQIRGGSADPR